MNKKKEKKVEVVNLDLPKTENPGESWNLTDWDPAPEKQLVYLERVFAEYIQTAVDGGQVIEYPELIKRLKSVYSDKGLKEDILFKARGEAFNRVIFDKFVEEYKKKSEFLGEGNFLSEIGKNMGLTGRSLYNIVEYYRFKIGAQTMWKTVKSALNLEETKLQKPAKSKAKKASNKKDKESMKDSAEKQLDTIQKHCLEKDAFTREMLRKADKVNTVLDVFAGKKSFYKDTARNDGLTEYSFVVTNDINFSGNHTFNWDAADVINLFVRTKSKFDIVDLDSFSCPAYFATLRDMIALTNDILFITCGLIDRTKTSESIVRSWGIRFEKGKSFTKQLAFEITRVANEMGREVEFLGEVRFDGTRRLAFKFK